MTNSRPQEAVRVHMLGSLQCSQSLAKSSGTNSGDKAEVAQLLLFATKNLYYFPCSVLASSAVLHQSHVGLRLPRPHPLRLPRRRDVRRDQNKN